MSTSQVFIPHEQLVWVRGEILVDVDPKDPNLVVQVRIQDDDLPNEKARSISLRQWGHHALPQQNIDIAANGVEDMTKLNYLHEASILDNLRRYIKVTF